MSCDDCIAAEPYPAGHGGYRFNDCEGCKARALAVSILTHRAKNGDPGPLQEAIRKTFPDNFSAGQLAVWDWFKKIEAAKP